MFAIRGAIQVERDSVEAIRAAVRALCERLLEENGLPHSRVLSAVFTLTPDLTAGFPAGAAREAGWGTVPMLCAQEIPVPGAAPQGFLTQDHELERESSGLWFFGANTS